MRKRSILVAGAGILAASLAIGDDRFVEPPEAEPADIASSIARVEKSLSGGTSVSVVLSDPELLPLHPYPRFRELIRRFGRESSITIVTPDEPGVRLLVVGRVKDESGRPVAAARAYVYQTSASGWYAEQAAHYSAMAGDERHARLFGYVVTDSAGRFEVRTIRPAGYPGSDLPAHIHVYIARPGEERETVISEILFEDDPRLTAEARDRSRRAGFLILPVESDGTGQRVTAEFVLR